MQEYRDGSFGEIREGSELLKKLADNPDEMVRTKAVHFGTKDELQRMKFSNAQMDRLMRKMEQLDRKLSQIIVALHIPTPGEIQVVPGSPAAEENQS